jgi:hypothetical protein
MIILLVSACIVLLLVALDLSAFFTTHKMEKREKSKRNKNAAG